MFSVGDSVLYGVQGICIVDSMMEREFKGEKINYYVLKPINNINSVLYVPSNNKELVSKIKKVLNEKEIIDLLHSIEGKLKWIEHDHTRRDQFKQIIKDGNRNEIIKLIRLMYDRQMILKEKGKKMHATDLHIFDDAKHIIHEEFSYVLKMNEDEVVEYISKHINK